MKTSVRDTYLNFDHSNMDFGILMNAVDEARLLEEGVFVEFGTGMGVAGRLIIPHLSGEWFYTVDPYEPYEGNAVGDIDPREGVNQNM